MISICIPVYNQDVRALVQTLRQQVDMISVPCEIVLTDDGSDEVYKNINQLVCSGEKYIELTDNIGRSRIRNLFLKHARFEFLLFLDCDAQIQNDDFLQKYLEAITNYPDVKVVCGGWSYPQEKPVRSERLRWKYGKLRESRSVDLRRKNPGKSFMSGNFLIRKEVLSRHPFDERISEYGHEDTLLGFTLKQNGISIHHIENSPVNGGKSENNQEFLIKTEKSITNLSRILTYVGFNPSFVQDVGLLRIYKKVGKFEVVLKSLFQLSQPLIGCLLKRGYGSIKMFDFYKLGYFIEMTSSDIRRKLR